MEIVLEEVSYNSSNNEELLNNITYTFNNSITFVNGLSAKLLYELLFQKKKTKNGFVALDKKGVYKDVIYISNHNEYNKGNLYDEIVYLNKYYKLNYKRLDKRIKDSLKMVNLDFTYIYKSFSEMSDSELKLVYLAIAMFLNSKIIILDYFEKGLSFNEINYIKKLVVKLNKMYNKNIIIFSNDLDAYLNIVKNIVIFKNGNIVFEGTNKDLYNKDLYKYIDKPNIVSFINYLNDNNHDFDHYIDIKELLKAIYRDVENK